MRKLTPQDVFNRLKDEHSLIHDAIHDAWTKLDALRHEKGGEYAASLRARTLSSILQNYVVEKIGERLPFETFRHKTVDLFQSGDLVIRFKKKGRRGLPMNIPTTHNDMICNAAMQQTITEGDVLFITISYEVERGWKGLGSIEVLLMFGHDKLEWAYEVPSDTEVPSMQQYMSEILPPTPIPEISIRPAAKLRKTKNRAE